MIFTTNSDDNNKTKFTLIPPRFSLRIFTASLARSCSDWVPILFATLVSFGVDTLLRSSIYRALNHLFSPCEYNLMQCMMTYSLCNYCDAPPLTNPGRGSRGWVPHPPSETVCHCSPWSTRAWSAPSRGRCWWWGQNFSCRGSVPICLKVGACWVGI